MKRLIILFGAPGSGKGLLGDTLSARFGLTKIATGDILRAEVKAKTPLGRRIASDVRSGILLDDTIVNPIVIRALAESSGDVILDGYPRRLSQFDFLRQTAETGFDTVCVYVGISVEAVIARIGRRRICEKCGATHPVEAGCCPKCGGRSVVREDDALIKKRLDVYLRTTWPVLGPLISWCRKTVAVDGGSIEKICRNDDALRQIL